MTAELPPGARETPSPASAFAVWRAARSLTMIAAWLGGPNRQQSPDPLNNALGDAQGRQALNQQRKGSRRVRTARTAQMLNKHPDILLLGRDRRAVFQSRWVLLGGLTPKQRGGLFAVYWFYPGLKSIGGPTALLGG